MTVQVFGIKIILDDKAAPVSENFEIGLYNVTGSNSEFRWIQNDIIGVTNWKSGMIVKGGIKPFSIEIDLRRGGNPSMAGNGGVVIQNIQSFWKTIQDAGIIITGCKAEIYIFNGTTPTKYRNYICENPSWNSKEYSIPFKGIQEYRRTNLIKEITSTEFPKAIEETIGKKIPLTIGKNFPEYDLNNNITRNSVAKGVRTANKLNTSIYTNAYFTNGAVHSELIDFPIVDVYSPNSSPYIDFELNGTVNESIIVPSAVLNPVDNTFIFISSGKAKGIYVKVYAFLYRTTTTIQVLLSDYMSTLPENQLGSDPSWFRFVIIDREYNFDFYPCKSFLDIGGNEITQNPKILSYDSNNKLTRLMDNGFESKGLGTGTNKIAVNPLLYVDDLDSPEGATCIPVLNIYPYTASNLSVWNGSGENDWTTREKKIDGVYSGSSSLDIAAGTVINPTYGFNRISTDTLEFDVTVKQNSSDALYNIVLGFTLPEPPETEYDEVYIGLKMVSKSDRYSSIHVPSSDSSFRVQLRRWKYGIARALNTTKLKENTADGGTVNDIPDFYYLDVVDTGNRGFLQPATPYGGSGDYYDLITGLSVFQFDGVNSTNYKSYVEGLLVWGRYILFPDGGLDTIRLTDLCMIFKKTGQSIKDAVFSPFSGRIFNSTFGGRKTASDLIEKPIDVLEHICRLQNWHDTSIVPTLGWGLAYGDGALIRTSGRGSFDTIGLPTVALCAQLQEDGYTDELKRNITKVFNLANYQDNTGAECVEKLSGAWGIPAYTVTLAEIMERTEIELIEPDPQTLYAEPYVNYSINSASGEFERKIKIRNTLAAAYSTSFAEGISGQDAADAWGACHTIALKTRMINEPPEDLTDLKFANGANADEIATNYLLDWTAWQGKTEISLPLHLNIVSSWTECERFNLNLPQQTAGELKQCIVEKIVIDPNPPYKATVKALIL